MLLKLSLGIRSHKVAKLPLASFGEQEETSYQLFRKCYAHMVVRHSIIGVHIMQPEELGEVR